MTRTIATSIGRQIREMIKATTRDTDKTSEFFIGFNAGYTAALKYRAGELLVAMSIWATHDQLEEFANVLLDTDRGQPRDNELSELIVNFVSDHADNAPELAKIVHDVWENAKP